MWSNISSGLQSVLARAETRLQQALEDSEAVVQEAAFAAQKEMEKQQNSAAIDEPTSTITTSQSFKPAQQANPGPQPQSTNLAGQDDTTIAQNQMAHERALYQNTLDEKERRAYQLVQSLLQKTQDQLLQGSVASQSGATPSQIPIEHEINLNLKTLTNYQLKLQLKAEEAIVDLAQSTTQILRSAEQLLEITTATETSEICTKDSKSASTSTYGENPSFHSKKIEAICKGLDKSSTQALAMSSKQARDDLHELLLFDDKLLSCDQMSKDIERFQERISRVEELIDDDDINGLAALLVELKLSLEMIQSFSFFQKQKQRLDRYESLILEYAQQKEDQILFRVDKKGNRTDDGDGEGSGRIDSNKTQVSLQQLELDKVVSLLIIYTNFDKEATFIDSFTEFTLVYEFDILVNEAENELTRQQQSSKWLSRTYFLEAFFKALSAFFQKRLPVLAAHFTIEDEYAEANHQQQLDSIFKNLTEKFLIKVVMQHREHIILEFCDQVNIEIQEKLYKNTILASISKVRELLPRCCQGDGTDAENDDDVLDTSLHLLAFEVQQGLLSRYKTLVDKTINNNLDAIKAKEDLQGCQQWGKNFKDIVWVCRQVLQNMISINACYGLDDVLHMVLKALERFLMQLCFTINQACSKKMHQGLVNPLNQAASQITAVDAQLCSTLENKFRWHAIYDLVFLYKRVNLFLTNFIGIDQHLKKSLLSLRDALEDADSAQTRMTYFICAFDRAKGPAWKEQLNKVWLSPSLPQAGSDSGATASQVLEWEGIIEMQFAKEAYRPIKAKVFQQDLLEGTLISNLQKIFVMPIYQDLSDLHILPLWKSLKSAQSGTLSFDSLKSRLLTGTQKSELFQASEPLDYMRRVGEHFRAFTTKLENHLTDRLVSIGGPASDESDDNDDEENKKEGDFDEQAQLQLKDWTGRIATYLTQVIALKVSRIKLLGDKQCEAQLVSDLIYYKRLMWQSSAQAVVFAPDFEPLRTLNQVQVAMVVDASFIRLNPSTREVRIDVDGCLTSPALQETLKSFETHDEFSTQAKVQELLSDQTTAILLYKRSSRPYLRVA